MRPSVCLTLPMADLSSMHELSNLKGFKMVHLNVRSLLKKMDQIRLLTEGAGVDVITISETWLKSHLNSALVSMNGYQAFRQDRGSKNKSNKRGGGLISYVKIKHASSCEPLEELDTVSEHIEAQWLYFHRQHCKDMVLCNIYRPPNGDLKKAIDYLDICLKTLNLSKINLFLLGDYNINYKNKGSPNYKKFNFFVQANGLSQHIKATTRNNDKTKSLLDLAISNSKFISRAGTLDHFISDHQPIYIVHKKGRDLRETVEFKGRSYRNFDSKSFKERLLEIDWGDLYNMSDPENAWKFILKNITSVLDTICPVRTFKIKNYRPDWMTKELIEQIKDRDYFYKKAKSQGDEDAWNIAKYLRNLTNVNIRQAKRDFILEELNTHNDDPKKFWKVIHKVVPTKGLTQKSDILLKDDGVKVTKGKVAQFINDYFINVGNFQIPDPADRLTPDQASTQDDPAEHSFPNLNRVTESEVFKIVKDINVSKSSGLDDISSFVVKESFMILISEITHMYNISISSSKFPNSWKQATVIPIPKAGNLTLVQNYRPISLLPLPGKVIEKLILQQLSGFLEVDSILDDNQHGFRKNHSTVHSVTQLTNYISKKMDSKIPTLVAYIDFKKAFDCVQHPILLDKLSQLGVGGAVTDWVDSYLTNRCQRVYANGTYSSYQTVTQGVPQGSVLGPLFYIIYANDISNIVKKCEIAMYADDTVLYTASANFERAFTNLQDDINSLSMWCKDNGIMANTDKTKVMLFGSTKALSSLPQPKVIMSRVPLEAVSVYKYLGVSLDSQLNYNLHVNKLISSVTARLKQFRRMRSFLNTKAALMVYKNMLLPMLEYGDIFLSATSIINRKRLQVLQNKGLRCAMNKGIETSTDELHAQAGLLKLKFRREQHLLNFMFDQAQDPTLLKRKPENAIRTRSSNKKLLRTKRPFTEKFKNSLAYRGPKKWNALPENCHHVQTKAAYKALVSKLVQDKSTKAKANLDVSLGSIQSKAN